MTPLAFETQTSDASKAVVVVRRLSSHFPRPLRRRATRVQPCSTVTWRTCTCASGCMSELLHSETRIDGEGKGAGEALRMDYKRKGWVHSPFFFLHYLIPSIFSTVLSERRRTERVKKNLETEDRARVPLA